MAEFMILMKGTGKREDWPSYIDKLIKSNLFRGGSELGNGTHASKVGSTTDCTITGFMRFEANSQDQILELLPGNPVYESGGSIEVLEIITS